MPSWFVEFEDVNYTTKNQFWSFKTDENGLHDCEWTYMYIHHSFFTT